jgi:hypothetical protein
MTQVAAFTAVTPITTGKATEAAITAAAASTNQSTLASMTLAEMGKCTTATCRQA